MKGRGTLERCYGSLTAKERFLVALDAVSRRDHEQVKELFRTCPHYTYRMADAAYKDLWDASMKVANMFALMWLSVAADYRRSIAATEVYLSSMGSFFTGYLLGVNVGWKEGGQRTARFQIEGLSWAAASPRAI